MFCLPASGFLSLVKREIRCDKIWYKDVLINFCCSWLGTHSGGWGAACTGPGATCLAGAPGPRWPLTSAADLSLGHRGAEVTWGHWGSLDTGRGLMGLTLTTAARLTELRSETEAAVSGEAGSAQARPLQPAEAGPASAPQPPAASQQQRTNKLRIQVFICKFLYKAKLHFLFKNKWLPPPPLVIVCPELCLELASWIGYFQTPSPITVCLREWKMTDDLAQQISCAGVLTRPRMPGGDIMSSHLLITRRVWCPGSVCISKLDKHGTKYLDGGEPTLFRV